MDRSGAMFGIWLGVGMAGIGAAIYGGWANQSITGLFAVLMIGALLATAMVWSEPLIKSWQTLRTEQVKAKHTPENKIALLREMLDDDEWQSFKTTLKAHVLAKLETDAAANDGELPLAALVDEQESAQRAGG